MRNELRAQVAALAALAVLAVACGGDDEPPGVTATADRTMLQAGEEVTLTIAVTGFRLVDPGPAPPNRDGEGHYHVYLDQATGDDYLLAAAGATANVQIPAGTSPGAHTLRVELQENDHTPVAGAGSASVAITILAPTPTLAASVSPNPVMAGDTLTIDLAVTDFVLDHAAAGSPAVPGRGHYHIHIDDPDPSAYQQFSGMDPSTWTVVAADPPGAGELFIPAGTHDIILVLVQNDHTPLDPPVTTTIPITVGSASVRNDGLIPGG